MKGRGGRGGREGGRGGRGGREGRREEGRGERMQSKGIDRRKGGLCMLKGER